MGPFLMVQGPSGLFEGIPTLGLSQLDRRRPLTIVRGADRVVSRYAGRTRGLHDFRRTRDRPVSVHPQIQLTPFCGSYPEPWTRRPSTGPIFTGKHSSVCSDGESTGEGSGTRLSDYPDRAFLALTFMVPPTVGLSDRVYENLPSPPVSLGPSGLEQGPRPLESLHLVV